MRTGKMGRMSGGCLTVLLATGVSGLAQELLPDPHFSTSAPPLTLRGWKVQGSIAPRSEPQGGVRLSPERTGLPDGREAWQGTLTLPASLEVLPGRRYKLQVEARGAGPFQLGLQEFGWKYSEVVLSSPGTNAALTTEFRTLTFDYSPSADRVAYVRPFFRVEGWMNRADVMNASLVALPGQGEVTLQAGHFLASPGGKIPLTLRASSYPVKLLLYGPSGECGPGGALGGSGGFVDHFTSSLTQDGKAGEQTACPFPLEPAAREGSYRLVAVEPAGGAQAVLHISVLAEKPARELLDRVEKVRLPKGSRLVFLGDSLTALFPGRNYPSILDRALRWRLGAEVEVINAGVSGNTILAMANRLEADVLQKNPTHVFVFEGANSCKRPYSPDTGQLGGWALPEDKYEAAWRDVLARLKEKKVKVVIMTMAPGDREILDAIEGVARKFGEKKNFWCDPATVAQVVAIQKRLAAEFGAEVIDVNALLSQRMAERARTGSPHYLHVDDGVHIGDFGAEAVAEAVLDYLGAAAK